MYISYNTVKDNYDTSRGYGSAGYGVVTSLGKLGHRVEIDDDNADIQLSFCQPWTYSQVKGKFNIGYTPWESTVLPVGWQDTMNTCDEVWATSDWTANVYRNAGITVPVRTYLHGIDPRWQPMEREPKGVVRFLHIGEPALRKGGQMAIDAFRDAFGDRTDVHLTIKAYYQHWTRAFSKEHANPVSPDAVYNNVTVLKEKFNLADMQYLYASHDVMVYPSYGEGFGLIPLQALATGMPTICTSAWAPYAHHLGDLALDSTPNRSVWAVHPGNVLYPDYDQLVHHYRDSFNNLSYFQQTAYANAPAVIKEFDWLTTTKNAFEHLS